MKKKSSWIIRFDNNSELFFCVDAALIPLINIANEKMHIDTVSPSNLQDICLEFLQTVIGWGETDRHDNSDNYSVRKERKKNRV